MKLIIGSGANRGQRRAAAVEDRPPTSLRLIDCRPDLYGRLRLSAVERRRRKIRAWLQLAGLGIGLAALVWFIAAR